MLKEKATNNQTPRRPGFQNFRSVRNFKIIIFTILKNLVEKADKIHEHMENSRRNGKCKKKSNGNARNKKKLHINQR